MNKVHNSLIENLQLVVDNFMYDLNVQLIENLNNLGMSMGNTLHSHLDAVKEYLDQKFDSHAPIACMENIDETVLNANKEEETAAEAKEDDHVAEEAKERAQKTTVEEDTATAETASTNIIHKGGITSARAETNKNINEKKGTEAKEEGQVAEEDEISIQKIPPLLYLDEEKDKAEIEKASTTISHNLSRNDHLTNRLQRYTSQQLRAKATTAAHITKYITNEYKNATDPRSTKLKLILRMTEGKDE